MSNLSKVPWEQLSQEPLSPEEKKVFDKCRLEHVGSRCFWRWINYLVDRGMPLKAHHLFKLIAHYVYSDLSFRGKSSYQKECQRVKYCIYSLLSGLNQRGLRDRHTRMVKDLSGFKQLYFERIGVYESKDGPKPVSEPVRPTPVTPEFDMEKLAALTAQKVLENTPGLRVVTNEAKQQLEVTRGELVVVQNKLQVVTREYEAKLEAKDSLINDYRTKVGSLQSENTKLEKLAARGKDADERVREALDQKEEALNAKLDAERQRQLSEEKYYFMSNRLDRELRRLQEVEVENKELKNKVNQPNMTEEESMLLETIASVLAGKVSVDECTGYESSEIRAAIDLYIQGMGKTAGASTSVPSFHDIEASVPSNGNKKDPWTGHKSWDVVRSCFKTLDIETVRHRSAADGCERFGLIHRNGKSSPAQTHIAARLGKVNMSQVKVSLNQLGGNLLVEKFLAVYQG
jgi:hypothetical protein